MRLLSTALVWVLALTVGIGGRALGANTPMEPPMMPLEEITLDNSLFEMTVKEAKSRRQPNSGSALTDKDLSADFRDKFRPQFLGMQSADDVEKLLAETEKNYDSYSPDVQYFVAQLQTLKPMRGIVYRLRPIFEPRSNRSVHSVAVTTLKVVASVVGLYLPTEQWEAGFEYVTTPSRTEALNQFKTVREFQAWLVNVMAPHLVAQRNRITAIMTNHKDAKPFVWDNKLFYGKGAFDDELDRYRAHHHAEMFTMLGTYSMGLHGIASFVSYDHDDLLAVTQSMGRLAGLEYFKYSDDLGVSAEERAKVLRSYPKFLTLRTDVKDYGKNMMSRSFAHLSHAVKYFDGARKVLEARGGASDPAMLFDPAQYHPSREYIKLRVDNQLAMIGGRTKLRSPITGETVEIDIPAFFKTPPTDLKDLLPVTFDQTPKEYTTKTTAGKKLQYRNYFRGRAIGWDSKKWDPYVPGAMAAGNSYMASALRNIRHNWGSEYLGPVLDLVIR